MLRNVSLRCLDHLDQRGHLRMLLQDRVIGYAHLRLLQLVDQLGDIVVLILILNINEHLYKAGIVKDQAQISFEHRDLLLNPQPVPVYIVVAQAVFAIAGQKVVEV